MNHAKRFTMPLEFAAVGQGTKTGPAVSPLAQPAAQYSGGTSLAQIYAFARQQAVAKIEGRKWRELIEKIMQ